MRDLKLNTCRFYRAALSALVIMASVAAALWFRFQLSWDYSQVSTDANRDGSPDNYPNNMRSHPSKMAKTITSTSNNEITENKDLAPSNKRIVGVTTNQMATTMAPTYSNESKRTVGGTASLENANSKLSATTSTVKKAIQAAISTQNKGESETAEGVARTAKVTDEEYASYTRKKA